MKLCDSHWSKLRDGVHVRGLSQLVAADGAEAMARVERERAEGEQSAATFDPLLNSTMAIYTRAIEAGGLYLMGQKPDGSEYCPLCELDEHAKNDRPELGSLSHQWIEGCLDAHRKQAEALGLVGKPS